MRSATFQRVAAFSLMFGAGSAATAQTLPNGVAAGDTTSGSAVLWTHSTALGNVTFQWSTDPAFGTIAGSQNAAVTSTDLPVQIDATGLAPGTRYYYRVVDAAGSTASGQFRTFASSADPSTAGAHFGVTGDWRGEIAPYGAIRNAVAMDLDYFIGLGDTIYADYPTPALPVSQAQTLAEFRARHNEVYSTHTGLNTLADLRAGTNWFAMIDDHEVTDDFAGYELAGGDPRFAYGNPAPGTRINRTPLFANGVQAFREYNPIRPTNYSTPGNDRFDGLADLYRARSMGQAGSFIMVDERTFRDQELTPPANPFDPAQVGPYLAATFDPTRTMLGNVQLTRLEQDLLSSYNRGETWRFVMLPEPIQNLGPVLSQDRYEGYNAERSALLGFIHDHNIPNVVFITADIHGTVVNNLTYATAPGGPQVHTGAFEISVGSLGFSAPFGPTVAEAAANLGIDGALTLPQYLALSASEQEEYIRTLLDVQTLPFGYDGVGLDGSEINAHLLQGGWTVTNNYSWTEFGVDAATGVLTVTTWGTPWYTPEFAAANPALVAGMQPQILQQFTVTPQPVPVPGAAAVLAGMAATAARRRR